LPHWRGVAVLVMGALASSALGTRNLLAGQAHRARELIPRAWDVPPRADGIYICGGGPADRWQRGVPFDLHLMVSATRPRQVTGARTPTRSPACS
jgi:hypothetical protein